MRFVTIVLLLLAGVLAGAQLGKIAPLVGWYQQDVGFSLLLVGWLVALIGLFVAIAALPAGIAIARVGTRRAAGLSFLVLGAGAFMLAAADSPTLVLVARLVEGLGYLVLVIAVPALLSSLAPPRWQGPVMAVWGGFVPIGFAIANFLSAYVTPAYGERAFLYTIAALFAGFALPAMALFGRVDDMSGHAAPPQPQAAMTAGLGQTLTLPVCLLSIAFGLYVVSSIGFFTFVPTFVTETGGRILFSAAVMALLVPLGNLVAGLLLHGRDGRFAVRLAAAAFLTSAVAAWPAFTSEAPLAATLAAMVVAIGGGVVASALFAAIPAYVPERGSLSIAIGLVAQSGGIGTLAGPPLTAAIIGAWSWPGLGFLLSLAAALGALCLLPLLRGGDRN